MAETLDAVFEDGKFRLLEAPDIPLSQGQRVRITFEAEAEHGDVLALAEAVYGGLSGEEVEEVEKIALDRRAFFGGREGWRHPYFWTPTSSPPFYAGSQRRRPKRGTIFANIGVSRSRSQHGMRFCGDSKRRTQRGNKKHSSVSATRTFSCRSPMPWSCGRRRHTPIFIAGAS